MLKVHRGNERGHIDHGWLDTYHTFSFGRYQNREMMNYRALRVMNEDVVAPGTGFGEHGHENMEIVTVVLSGELQHRDSLGSGEVLTPDEVQWMSAGSGIRHSEFNPSSTAPVHLYQIWLIPDRPGHVPAYRQQRFERGQRKNRWQTLVSQDGSDNSLTWRTDATLWRAELASGAELALPVPFERAGWLQVLKGEARVGNESLAAGDGVAIADESSLVVQTSTEADLLLFELA